MQEFLSMRLKRGVPFEQGVEELWDKVEDLEAMRCPVLGALEGNDLEIRKKEILYTFLHGNPDFEKVLTDHDEYNYTYNSMFAQCVSVQQKLPPSSSGSHHRGGREHGSTGGYHRGGREQGGSGNYHRGGREQGSGGSHRGGHDQDYLASEQPQHGMTDHAQRPSQEDRSQALQQGWDPGLQHKGYFSRQAKGAKAIGQCYCYQLHKRCPFGDTCKYMHVDKRGNTITSGVMTAVPNAFICSFCHASGHHWSFDCDRKPRAKQPSHKKDKTTPLLATSAGEVE
jgi:hypothetical protein